MVSQKSCKLQKGWYYKDGRNGVYRCAKTQRTAYGGQRNSAEQITKMLPETKIYVEPFAGHAYNWQSMKKHGKIKEKAILGDKNCEAINWIKKSRKTENTILKCQDWKKTVAQTDSRDTLTLFDPPWDPINKCYGAYKGNCAPVTPEIVKIATKMKGTAVLLDRDTPEKRKIICKDTAFRCRYIKVNGQGMMKKKKPWSEIVAIKD